jgi:hypothetical protein
VATTTTIPVILSVTGATTIMYPPTSTITGAGTMTTAAGITIRIPPYRYDRGYSQGSRYFAW